MSSVLETFAPHPALARYVEGYAVSRDAPGSAPLAVRVLPDGNSDVLFEAPLGGGRVRAEVFGVKTRALDVRDATPTEKIAVRFRPGAAARFLGVRARDLADGAVELAALGGSGRALGRAAQADDLPARLARLEEVLLARRDALESPSAGASRLAVWAGVDAAVAALTRGGGQLRMDALCTALGVGPRRLERIFAEEVGVPPKRLARILRFRRAVAALARGEAQAAAAARLGYADQAHLLREFRALAGAPPGEALARALSNSSNPGDLGTG